MDRDSLASTVIQCDKCSYTTPYKTTLQQHIMKHHNPSGVNKPYQCEYCPYKTLYKGNLDKHLRIHTGERPYRCRFCSKDFSCQSNHKAHEERHAGFYKFKCPYKGCAFGTNRKVQYDTHVERMHRNEIQAGGMQLAPSTTTGTLPGLNKKRSRTQSASMYNAAVRPRQTHPMYRTEMNDAISPMYNKLAGMPGYNDNAMNHSALQVALPDQQIRLPSAQTLLKKEPISPSIGLRSVGDSSPVNQVSNLLGNPFAIPDNKDDFNVDRSSVRNIAMSLASSMLKPTISHEMNRHRTDTLVQDLLQQSVFKPEKTAHYMRGSLDSNDQSSGYLEPNESESSLLSSPSIDNGPAIDVQIEPLSIEPVYEQNSPTTSLSTMTSTSSLNQPITDQHNTIAQPITSDHADIMQPVELQSSQLDNSLSQYLSTSPAIVVNTSTPNSNDGNVTQTTASNIAKVKPKLITAEGNHLTPSSNNINDATAALLDNLVGQGRLFRCDHCNILFPEYSMFLMHAGTHESQDNPFQCHYCHKMFAHKYEFMSHFVQCIHN